MEATQRIGLAEVREKTREVLIALMQAHNQRLYRTARAIVRDEAEAEDVVQETYLKALGALAGFRGDASLATWLTRIAMNEAFARNRRRRRHHELRAGVAPVFDVPTASPERHAYDDEVRRALEAAVDALPEPLRLVFVLRVLEDMPLRETADLLGISQLNVRVRLFRARAALRRALSTTADLGGVGAFEFGGHRCAALAGRVLLRLSVG